MTWEQIDPRTREAGSIVAPLILSKGRFADILTGIDDTSSDCRTLDLLSALLVSNDPAAIVEVGTYRGIGSMVMAETIRMFDLQGHIWTCDPVDYGVNELFDKTGLSGYVTYIQGTFEDAIRHCARFDFCYVDASSADEPSLRLRYSLLALEYLREGGILVCDDAGGDWLGAPSLRRYAKRSGIYLSRRRGVAVFQV